LTSLQLAATQTLDLHLSQTLEEELLVLVLVMSRNYLQQPEASDDESKNITVDYSTTTERERKRERERDQREIDIYQSSHRLCESLLLSLRSSLQSQGAIKAF